MIDHKESLRLDDQSLEEVSGGEEVGYEVFITECNVCHNQVNSIDNHDGDRCVKPGCPGKQVFLYSVPGSY